MTKMNLIAVLATLIVLQSCADDRQFVKSRTDVKVSMKRVLLLPVYVPTDFFPKLPRGVESEMYSAEFRKKVVDTIKLTKPILDDAARNVLAGNTLGLEITHGRIEDYAILKLSESQSPFYRRTVLTDNHRTYNWPFNRTWLPNMSGINSLMVAHKVDGVVLQTVAVNRIWFKKIKRLTPRTTSTIVLPLDAVMYQASIYNNQGLVYGGEANESIAIHDGDYHYENVNGNILGLLQEGESTDKMAFQIVPSPITDVISQITTLTLAEWTLVLKSEKLAWQLGRIGSFRSISH